jgi:hypothetical protein
MLPNRFTLNRYMPDDYPPNCTICHEIEDEHHLLYVYPETL